MRDQRGRGGRNPDLSPTVSSFNSNTNIGDGGRGQRKRRKRYTEKNVKTLYIPSTISNLPGRQMGINR